MEQAQPTRLSHVSAAQRNRQQQQLTYKRFLRDMASLVIARAYILGPLERMKIIMQVKNIANFTNPADKPKNIWDLSNKVSIN